MLAQLIRVRRAELGLSQLQLAAAVGVDVRQIRRYEAGTQQPVLPVAVALAEALQVSLNELAGNPSHRVNLTGDWWVSWQTFNNGMEGLDVHQLRALQRGDEVMIEAVTRGVPLEQGGYLWHGEMRLWDKEILMGWYAATEGSVGSKGTLYFMLHPYAQRMTGRWAGLGSTGEIVSGWGAMAADEETARTLMSELRERRHDDRS